MIIIMIIIIIHTRIVAKYHCHHLYACTILDFFMKRPLLRNNAKVKSKAFMKGMHNCQVCSTLIPLLIDNSKVKPKACITSRLNC